MRWAQRGSGTCLRPREEESSSRSRRALAGRRTLGVAALVIVILAAAPTLGGGASGPEVLHAINASGTAPVPCDQAQGASCPPAFHMTLPPERRAVVYEIGPVPQKPEVRFMCDACAGVRWVLQRPGSDYTMPERLFVNAATVGVLAMTGGGNITLVEWNF